MTSFGAVRGWCAGVGLGVALAAMAPSGAEASAPDDGLNWATIGHAGNRSPLPGEVSEFSPDFTAGSVDYGYRITRTPVTLGSYFEFVEAYAPYASDTEEFGFQILNLANGQPPIIWPGSDPDWAVEAPLRMAKRMANWLHNGKVIEQWAFESGAYDTSTFGMVPLEGGGVMYTDQVEPSPGAKYWIPSIDEWTKANYYDPNRYGDGEEGYWLYPHMSMDAPIPGLPWEGGETDAGLDGFPGEDFPQLPVGSYPNVKSAFGLLDASGGERELTGSVFGHINAAIYASSFAGSSSWELSDQLGFYSGTAPTFPGFTFRLASVPAPSGFICVMIAGGWCTSRRRRA